MSETVQRVYYVNVLRLRNSSEDWRLDRCCHGEVDEHETEREARLHEAKILGKYETRVIRVTEHREDLG